MTKTEAEHVAALISELPITDLCRVVVARRFAAFIHASNLHVNEALFMERCKSEHQRKQDDRKLFGPKKRGPKRFTWE